MRSHWHHRAPHAFSRQKKQQHRFQSDHFHLSHMICFRSMTTYKSAKDLKTIWFVFAQIESLKSLQAGDVNPASFIHSFNVSFCACRSGSVGWLPHSKNAHGDGHDQVRRKIIRKIIIIIKKKDTIETTWCLMLLDSSLLSSHLTLHPLQTQHDV